MSTWNYEAFKSTWTSALREAGLLSPYDRPEESIDLEHMDRRYFIRLGMHTGPQLTEPFTTSCELSWRWRALHSVRTATTEEDLLTELHGRDEAADMDTERPWLRVEVKLHATLPWGQPSAMPSKATWTRFAASVAKEIAPLLSEQQIEFNAGSAVLGWCGQPEATVQCEADGRVLLTGVTLEAWQPILLPRKWDDPDREADDDPTEELAGLADRVKEAMERWMEGVKVLRIVDVSVN